MSEHKCPIVDGLRYEGGLMDAAANEIERTRKRIAVLEEYNIAQSDALDKLRTEKAELKRRTEVLLKLTAFDRTKDIVPDAWAEIAGWFNEDGSAK